MRISRTRGFKLNMGNYESYEFGASVTLDHNDLGLSDQEVLSTDSDWLATALTEKVIEILNHQLKDELREAAELTDRKSFILRDFHVDKPKKRVKRGKKSQEEGY